MSLYTSVIRTIDTNKDVIRMADKVSRSVCSNIAEERHG
jgi:hypothetical protein